MREFPRVGKLATSAFAPGNVKYLIIGQTGNMWDGFSFKVRVLWARDSRVKLGEESWVHPRVLAPWDD